MKYENILPATFLSRPNRFVAHILVAGREHRCHVKNTGRCRELLIPGAGIFVRKADGEGRKTPYDLIAVQKGGRLVNIDSQAPNKAFHEWLLLGKLFPDIVAIRPERRFQSSRFDFYVETPGERSFIEVKGVTLEQDGVVLFPDAPTERGVRHLRELCQSVGAGYGAYVAFVIQMKGVRFFTPNTETHPAFAEALKEAAGCGVKLLALDCAVTPDEMRIEDSVELRLP